MTIQQPIYGRSILEAIGLCPIIMEKLNLFSKPIEMKPLRESTVLNLIAFAKAFEKEKALASRVIVSAAEVTQAIESLEPWMQARVRGTGTLPFKQSPYDPIVRLVRDVLVADGPIFPATDIHITLGFGSDTYHRASETLDGIGHAITSVWRLTNPRIGFAEDSWSAVIKAAAKRRESPAVSGGHADASLPVVTFDQAVQTVYGELVTDPFKRMGLGIVHAAGLGDPALDLFARRAANSCQAVFSAWATFLLASFGKDGCERWYSLFERLIDDYATGNFLVGIDEFTLLVA